MDALSTDNAQDNLLDVVKATGKIPRASSVASALAFGSMFGAAARVSGTDIVKALGRVPTMPERHDLAMHGVQVDLLDVIRGTGKIPSSASILSGFGLSSMRSAKVTGAEVVKALGREPTMREQQTLSMLGVPQLDLLDVVKATGKIPRASSVASALAFGSMFGAAARVSGTDIVKALGRVPTMPERHDLAMHGVQVDLLDVIRGTGKIPSSASILSGFGLSSMRSAKVTGAEVVKALGREPTMREQRMLRMLGIRGQQGSLVDYFAPEAQREVSFADRLGEPPGQRNQTDAAAEDILDAAEAVGALEQRDSGLWIWRGPGAFAADAGGFAAALLLTYWTIAYPKLMFVIFTAIEIADLGLRTRRGIWQAVQPPDERV